MREPLLDDHNNRHPTHRAREPIGLQPVSAVAAAALAGLAIDVTKLGCWRLVKADGAHLLLVGLPTVLTCWYGETAPGSSNRRRRIRSTKMMNGSTNTIHRH
jgi:hypothetical protein